MVNHNAMRAFVYVFPLLLSIVAAIFEATQRNRNVNKRTHCIVVDQDSLICEPTILITGSLRIQNKSRKEKLNY